MSRHYSLYHIFPLEDKLHMFAPPCNILYISSVLPSVQFVFFVTSKTGFTVLPYLVLKESLRMKDLWLSNKTLFCKNISCLSLKGFTLPNIGCAHVLGMEDHKIPDSAITASSEWSSNLRASNARLQFEHRLVKTGGWSARHNDKGQWLQIDLSKVWPKWEKKKKRILIYGEVSCPCSSKEVNTVVQQWFLASLKL